MNKGRRNELKQLKYRKRLKRMGQLNAESIASPKGENFNFIGFKNHSAPCSCIVCSHRKYNRARTKNDQYYKQASQSLHI